MVECCTPTLTAAALKSTRWATSRPWRISHAVLRPEPLHRVASEIDDPRLRKARADRTRSILRDDRVSRRDVARQVRPLGIEQFGIAFEIERPLLQPDKGLDQLPVFRSNLPQMRALLRLDEGRPPLLRPLRIGLLVVEIVQFLDVRHPEVGMQVDLVEKPAGPGLLRTDADEIRTHTVGRLKKGGSVVHWMEPWLMLRGPAFLAGQRSDHQSGRIAHAWWARCRRMRARAWRRPRSRPAIRDRFCRRSCHRSRSCSSTAGEVPCHRLRTDQQPGFGTIQYWRVSMRQTLCPAANRRSVAGQISTGGRTPNRRR